MCSLLRRISAGICRKRVCQFRYFYLYLLPNIILHSHRQAKSSVEPSIVRKQGLTASSGQALCMLFKRICESHTVTSLGAKVPANIAPVGVLRDRWNTDGHTLRHASQSVVHCLQQFPRLNWLV